jgi:peroxiredoxin family protein
MDLVLIVRDGLASSLVGNLLAARDARAAGMNVAVLLTGEALAAAAGGTFGWPRELAGQTMRLRLADRGSKELGLPLLAKGEGRQLDPKAFLAATAADGVPVYACPLWSTLLGVTTPPAGLTALDRPGLTRLLAEAGKVVGAL